MKNYSIIAAVVALALTLAFIVQFTGARHEGPVASRPQVQKSVTYSPKEANTVSHQELRITTPGVSTQKLEVR